MVLAFFGLGPTELILGLLCLGVVAGLVVVVVFLTTKTKRPNGQTAALEAENDRLRLELENQRLREEIERRKKLDD